MSEMTDTNLLVPEAVSVPMSLSEPGNLSEMTVIVLLKDTVLLRY